MSAEKRMAQVYIRLRGFAEPDVRSQFEGHLEPGKYVVKAYRANYPNQDTDYALVLAPALGAGDTWICSRWKDQRYAEISEQAAVTLERLGFDEDPMAIEENTLVNLLGQFAEFTYDLDEARYPYPLPGVRVPQAPPNLNNCCTFVEALLVKAWVEEHDTFAWNTERHGQMMIFSNDDFFSPVTAAVESGMGIKVADPDTPPHPWTLIQGWRRQWRGGHTFLIVDYHEDTDRVLTLESNSSYRLNGVGFRSLGNLKEFDGQPPARWWERDASWTWERVQSTYQYRAQARLKIKNREWSGL